MHKYSIMLQIILVLSFSSLFSCEGVMQKKYTPKEFLNRSISKKEDYEEDSIASIKLLRTLLLMREGFFDNKVYFDSTQLIIDTILYSPDFNRLAVFLMTQNPTYRQLLPNTKNKFYYDATCYLGSRVNDSISLSWIGPSFTNSPNRYELSKLIRDYYFRSFASMDSSGLNIHKYNLDDVRFWDCPIWKEVESEEKKRKEFESEKKNTS